MASGDKEGRLHEAGHASIADRSFLSELVDEAISRLPPVYYCTSGLDVTQDRGADVPEAVEESVYLAAHGNPDMAAAARYYNPSLPLVLIPIAWPEYPPNTALTAEGIRRVFFGRGRFDVPLPGATIHSVRNYYLANSYLDYYLREGQIADWATLSTPWRTYADRSGVNDASRDPQLAEDGLQAADVDWSPYIGPGDVVTPDRVQIVFITPYGDLATPTAPPPGSAGGTRGYDRSIRISWQGRELELRDHRYCYIACKQAIDPTRGSDDITFGGGLNVIVHEMNHALFRLPDRYEIRDDQGKVIQWDYVGDYDIMSNSSWEKYMTAYDRMKIGWIAPPIIRVGALGRTCYALGPSELFPAALVLYLDSAPDEYWVLENRDARFDHYGFDSGLPDRGLAIWWVDANSGKIALVQADDPEGKPLSNPTPTGPQLFKGSRFGAPVDFHLTPQYGSGSIRVSRVSPPGNPLFVEV